MKVESYRYVLGNTKLEFAFPNVQTAKVDKSNFLQLLKDAVKELESEGVKLPPPEAKKLAPPQAPAPAPKKK